MGEGGVTPRTVEVDAEELARLRQVDAAYGWRMRPPAEPRTHVFKPHAKWPWVCDDCGYGPSEPLKHHKDVQP